MKLLVDKNQLFNSGIQINDALLKAEKAQNRADMLKRNTNVLKRRLRQIIENQLEVIEEMDRVDFDRYDDKYQNMNLIKLLMRKISSFLICKDRITI